MKNEVWEEIPFSGGNYFISNYGRIKTRVKENGERLKCSKILKNSINKNGYPHVRLHLKELAYDKTLKIHKLVARLFRDNPRRYEIVNHIDGNKLNNYFMNLEWCTSAHNNQHALIAGLNVPAKGMARNKSTLTDADVIKIFKCGGSARETAAKYGVNHTCVVDIRSGRSWNHITGLLCTRTKRALYSKDIKYKV